MLIDYETQKSLEEVRKTLEEKAKEKGFGVMAVHEVSSILQSKGVPINYRCLTVEVCSPRHASKVLSADPCIMPTAMLELFKRPELKDVAEEVEKLIKEIMEESL